MTIIVLKNISKVTINPASFLILSQNLTFSTGVIPDDLKVELITPIFKGNDAMKFKNYRPISVLLCFFRLLQERPMINRLTKFIDKNNILSRHQYGFRKNRLTDQAIIDFVDKITKEIDERKYSVGDFP